MRDRGKGHAYVFEGEFVWTIGVAVGMSEQAGASLGFGVVHRCRSRTQYWCVGTFRFYRW